jgi:NitT/TauT family transport system permease protein
MGAVTQPRRRESPVRSERAPRRASRAGAVARFAEPAAVVLGALVLWQLVVKLGVLPERDVPAVTTILGELVDDLQGATLWESIWQTLLAWAIGLGIVIGVGIPVGLALGASSLAYRSTNLLLEFVRTIPSIAALPLLILLYGAGRELATVLVVLTALWPLLIQTMYGVRDVDPVTRETGRAYGLSRGRMLTRIVIPSASPYIATGLRLSATIGLILAIAASLVAGGEGLGNAIANASTTGQVPLMYARILVAGVLGLLVTLAFTRLERRFLHWHPSHRVTVV